ncbi:GPW/gp25 family protein [Myxococcus sp. K38C18041901]|uniref:GPW/gp25 family protein n=1 Tax=Myxococcus guangdongensis TaxID=2906760 RepID=UPI0020A7DF94|nr:GPW/gp25 family protein [Myxococcus guangdongensis]MCP3063927.1 GPW/gp25 family protein [Myxococcus guangdongensis]
METKAPSFLGTGWSFPPTFSRSTGGVMMASGELDIRESLWVLLSTSLGERTMLPNYGCELRTMVFRGVNTTLTRQIQDYVQQAILYWEPRIVVDAVTVQKDASVEGLLTITVSYVVTQTNSRSNLVYPFYLQEGSIPVTGP